MDVDLNTDRMLAYFDTSGHDDQTLREVHGLEPAPEFLEWALGRGIFARDEDGTVVRGPRWGDPRSSAVRTSSAELERLPAAYGFENAGPRPADAVSRALRANVARRPARRSTPTCDVDAARAIVAFRDDRHRGAGPRDPPRRPGRGLAALAGVARGAAGGRRRRRRSWCPTA